MPIILETNTDFIDITDKVNEEVRNSEVEEGLVIVYSPHTTLGIKIIENEKLLLNDMRNLLNKLVPKNGKYKHSCDRKNAHSHLRTLLLPTSEIIPIYGGKLDLGKWQRIFAIECDPGRNRFIKVKII